MSTKAIRTLLEMFGGVPIAHYTAAGMDAKAHETWKEAKAELEAIEKELAERWTALCEAKAAMEHMGEALNGMDAVDPEGEDAEAIASYERVNAFFDARDGEGTPTKG